MEQTTIEKVSGQPYDAYVKSAVLAPIGITDMRIGHSLPDEHAPKEVHYYDFPGAQPGPLGIPRAP